MFGGFVEGLFEMVSFPLEGLDFLGELFEFGYCECEFGVLVGFELEGESEFGVFVEEFDDLLFHGGLLLGVGGVQFLNDAGDFLFFDFFLVFLELFHGLLHVFLFVGVSGDDHVVLLLEGLELVFELLDGFGVFLVFLDEEFVLVEVGLE